MFRSLLAPLLAILLVTSFLGSSQLAAAEEQPTTLVVVWSSGDPDVAHRVALMYAHAAKTANWFENVRLIIWGPSQRVLVGDKDLKAKIAKMREDGVIVEACIACANSFGIAEELRELDLPVKGMGKPLSDYLKDPDCSVITY
ncbi:MAG: DsrE family protein [Verrucomicrobiota bacterium JB023]|nr:DsrE family protein [Verrucomicrobiota bacterium JB023]